MAITLPGESPEYRAARDQLLEREIDLRRAMEAVAAARRGLPTGGPVKQDYVFRAARPDGSPTNVRLSELFGPGKDSLVIYSFMFPRDPADRTPGPPDGETALLPLAEGPCPSVISTGAPDVTWESRCRRPTLQPAPSGSLALLTTLT